MIPRLLQYADFLLEVAPYEDHRFFRDFYRAIRSNEEVDPKKVLHIIRTVRLLWEVLKEDDAMRPGDEQTLQATKKRRVLFA